jgi:hypothetical protein
MTTTSPLAIPTTPPAPWTPVYVALLALDVGCGGIDVDALLVSPTPRTRGDLESAYADQRSAFKQLLKDYDRDHPIAPRLYFNESFPGTYGEFRVAKAAQEAEHTAHYANRRAHTDSHAKDHWAALAATLYHFATPGTSIGDLDYDDGPTPGPLTVLGYQGCRCCGSNTGYGDWVQVNDPTPPAALTVTPQGPLIAFPDEQGHWPAVVTDPHGLASLQADLTAAVAAADRALAEHEAAQRQAISLTPDQVDALGYAAYQKRARLLPVGFTVVGWATDVHYTPNTSSHDRATAHQRSRNQVYTRAGVHLLTLAL